MAGVNMPTSVHNARTAVKSKRTPSLCILHGIMTDTRPEQAKRLEAARELAGYPTRADAIRRFGYNKHTYNQHENGTRGIGRASGDYARNYRVSEGWLLTGDGEGPKPRTRSEKITTIRDAFMNLPPSEQREFLAWAVLRATEAAESRQERHQGPHRTDDEESKKGGT